MNKNLHNIQALRGIAVLMVVALHLFATEKKYSPDQLLPDFLQLGAAGVDIFFVISGFIMVSVTKNLQPSFSSMQQFLLMRAARIYPLYWIISLALLLIAQLFPGITTPLATNTLFVIKSFLLYPQENLPLLMVGWTLVHEMFFYLIFSCLLLLPRKKLPLALAAWALTTVYCYHNINFASPVLQIATHPMSLEFIGGCFLGIFVQRMTITSAPLVLFSGIAAMLAAWMLWQLNSDDILPIGETRVIYFLPGCLLITAGCIGLDQRGIHLSLWLEKIGDASYSIYLTHILFLSAFCKAWQFFPYRETLADNMIFLPLCTIVTLLGGLAFYQHCEKNILQKTRAFILR
jgi:exopolysaccharide production protein ExoZ